MPTMPLLCVDYTYIGGYQEVQDMEDFGELDDKLEKAGYIPKDEIRRRATAAMVKEEEERKAKEEEQRLAEEAKKREEELKMERRIRQLQGLPPLEEGEEKKDGELPPLHAEVEEKPQPTVKPVAVLEERAPPLPNFSANRGVVSVLSTTEEGSSIAGNYPSAASVVANSMKKKRQALMTYSEYKPSQSTSVKEGSGFGKLSTRELLELSRSNGTTLSHSKNATTLPPATTRSPTSPSKSKIDASAYSNPIIRTPAAPQDGGYAAKKGTKGADSVSPTMQTPLSSKSDNSAKAAAALLPSQRRLSKEPAQKNTGVLAH
ncbi:hypothetical protein, conserved [Angomonas deanei]|uniref:Uncharacterized protein n=1 Tax=Angomonas deanei TaxID=59799 RepID=A0A7G2C1W9_9TRYP|nr:hypothetical protein, conserved [Angomonas deanei]